MSVHISRFIWFYFLPVPVKFVPINSFCSFSLPCERRVETYGGNRNLLFKDGYGFSKISNTINAFQKDLDKQDRSRLGFSCLLFWWCSYAYNHLAPRLTQLCIKFIQLINVEVPTIVGILRYISMINLTSERLKARNFFTFRYFSFQEQLKFCAHLNWAWKMFNNIGTRLRCRKHHLPIKFWKTNSFDYLLIFILHHT